MTIFVAVAVPLAGLLLFFVYPLITIAWHSLHVRDGAFSFANYTNIVHAPGIVQAVLNSLLLGVVTGVICLVLGFAIAYTLERSAVRGKGLINGSLMLPLLAPSLVQALGLIFILGRNGLVARWTGWDINIYGFPGLLIADSFFALPQAVMILQASLRNADARYYDAAEVLGASKWRQFIDITLPSTKFGLLSAGFIVFAVTIADFGNAFVIGGSYTVLATEIFNQVIGQQDFGMGAVVGILLLLPSLIAIYIERVSSQQQSGVSSENMVPVTPVRSPVRDRLLGVICGVVGAIIVAVIAVVVFASFVKLWPYNMSLTLHNYTIDLSGGYSSLWTSLKVSLAVAAGGTILIFMQAFGLKNLSGPLAKASYQLAVLPASAPGLVIGLAYIFAFNVSDSPLHVLYGSALLIGICNFYHYHTQGFLTMMTGMRAVPSALEEVVSCLGGNIRCVLRDVMLPFTAPTAISVFFFLFMRSMVTLSAVIFLVTPTVDMASVAVLHLDQNGFVTQAAAFSTWIIIIVTAALLLMKLMLGQVTRRLGTVGPA